MCRLARFIVLHRGLLERRQSVWYRTRRRRDWYIIYIYVIYGASATRSTLRWESRYGGNVNRIVVGPSNWMLQNLWAVRWLFFGRMRPPARRRFDERAVCGFRDKREGVLAPFNPPGRGRRRFRPLDSLSSDRGRCLDYHMWCDASGRLPTFSGNRPSITKLLSSVLLVVFENEKKKK